LPQVLANLFPSSEDLLTACQLQTEYS